MPPPWKVAVGVADQTDGDLAGVLADGVLELVDVPADEAQLGLDVLDRRARADPELAVAGVAEELLGVARRERAEVEARLVAGLLVEAAEGLHDEDRVGLAVGAETGEVGEGGVRAEDVVAVVAAHLEPAGGDDEALTLVGGGDRGAALGGPPGRAARQGRAGDPAGSQRSHLQMADRPPG